MKASEFMLAQIPIGSPQKGLMELIKKSPAHKIINNKKDSANVQFGNILLNLKFDNGILVNIESFSKIKPESKEDDGKEFHQKMSSGLIQDYGNPEIVYTRLLVWKNDGGDLLLNTTIPNDDFILSRIYICKKSFCDDKFDNFQKIDEKYLQCKKLGTDLFFPCNWNDAKRKLGLK